MRCGQCAALTLAGMQVSHTMSMPVVSLSSSERCLSSSEASWPVLQGAPGLEAASSEAREAQMQSLMQLEAIQSDMSAALAAAQEAQGGSLALQDSLAKVTTLIETLVNYD